MCLVYPLLWNWLNTEEKHLCPVQVNLGPHDGYFYVRMQNGASWYSLPEDLRKRVDDSVKRVWLGSGDAYVIEKKDGKYLWDLAGCYPSLDDAMLAHADGGVEVRLPPLQANSWRGHGSGC